MRFKYDRSDPSSLRCCLCLHVRTGTILFGAFQLLLHLVIVGWYAVSVLDPALVEKYDLSFPYRQPQYKAEGDENGTLYTAAWRRQISSDDKFVAMLMFLGSLVMTMMLVHGAIKGRASYLLPFFVLQVFDFCITCLSVVGYFSYIPDIKRWIAAQEDFPFKEDLLVMDNDWLMLMTVLSVVLLLFVKSYLIGMVWSCYKYLSTYEENVARVTTRSFDTEAPNPDTEMLLPPKYEDAVRMAQNEPAPPAYTENEN